MFFRRIERPLMPDDECACTRTSERAKERKSQQMSVFPTETNQPRSTNEGKRTPLFYHPEDHPSTLRCCILAKWRYSIAAVTQQYISWILRVHARRTYDGPKILPRRERCS